MQLAVSEDRPNLVTHDLVNRHGDRVRLLNFGARICSVVLNLRTGPRDVVLGFADTARYLADEAFLGATIGRYSNRIGNGRFLIDDRPYFLTANDGPHQLHGGPEGFFRRFWKVGGGASDSSVEFCLESQDGDQGFPGRVRACTRYSWTDDRELLINYSATTDKSTHVSLTNHSYFNLDGFGQVLDHFIQISSDAVTEVDDDLIPTGEIQPVGGSGLDLATPVQLRDLAAVEHPLIRAGGGPDLNYILDGSDTAATLESSQRDLRLEVSTTCPGLQLYAGQHLGQPFGAWAGVCLETQYFPDSPNHAQFPSTLLLPGQLYSESTRFTFRVA